MQGARALSLISHGPPLQEVNPGTIIREQLDALSNLAITQVTADYPPVLENRRVGVNEGPVSGVGWGSHVKMTLYLLDRD